MNAGHDRVAYDQSTRLDAAGLTKQAAGEDRRRAAIAERIFLEQLRQLPADGRFVDVVPDHFEAPGAAPRAVSAWLSRDFLVLLYEEKGEGTQRLSVARARAVHLIRAPKRDSRLLTWSELMAAKRGVGLGAVWALELYPSDDHVVIAAAGMRHLWLVGEPPPFGWRSEQQSLHQVDGATAHETKPRQG